MQEAIRERKVRVRAYKTDNFGHHQETVRWEHFAGSVAQFNDDEHTTHRNVVNMLKRAIAIARKAERR